MEVFDHGGHTVAVRMVVISYICSSRTVLDFLNSIHMIRYLCQRDHTVEAYSSWSQTKTLYACSFNLSDEVFFDISS